MYDSWWYQIKRFKPELVSIKNESQVEELKAALADSDHKPEIIPGEKGIIEVIIMDFVILSLWLTYLVRRFM